MTAITTSGIFRSHGRQIPASTGAAIGFTSAENAINDSSAESVAGQRYPQAKQHQRNHQRVDMAATGNLPQGKRMPEIGDHARHRAVHAPQQQHDQGNGDGLAAQQRETHHSHVFTDPRDDEEEKLRHRRIDGDRGSRPG